MTNNSSDPKGVFIPRSKITSISLFAILICILAFSSIFIAGFNKGVNANENQVNTLASGAAYTTPVAECLIYTDEVVISEQECEFHTQCTPNGICLMDLNKCGYFIN